jgi:hypothetical protein
VSHYGGLVFEGNKADTLAEAMAALEAALADQTGHDMMTEPDKKTSDAGCLGGVLAGLFGVAVGFVAGWLSVGVLIPF